ncbi:MAG TPA: glycosyltransferase family 87 protein [bacterium]|nr:glycosyltransferase family 87 protein [bacterium]
MIIDFPINKKVFSGCLIILAAIVFCFNFEKLRIASNNFKFDNVEQSAEDFYAQYQAAKNYKVFYRPYPPTTSLFYLPFTKISYLTAVKYFQLLNLFFIITLIGCTAYLLDIKTKTELIYLICFSVLFQPLFLSYFFGQINILIALLITICIMLEISNISAHKKDLLIAIILSCGAHLKIFPAFLILLYFVFKRWRLISYFILSNIIILLIGIYFFSTEIMAYYFKTVIPATSKAWVITTVNNQSLLGLFTRLFSFSLEFGKSSIIYAPWLVKPIYYISVIFILSIFYKKLKKYNIFLSGDNNNNNTKQNCLNIFTFSIITAILIFGLNWTHTFNFIYFAVMFLIFKIIRTQYKSKIEIILIVSGFILLNFNIDFSKFQINALKHFITLPNYYGAFLLFICYIFFNNDNYQKQV